MPRPLPLIPWCLPLLLLACPEEPEPPPPPPTDVEIGVSLLPSGRHNHILPLDVAVDTPRRRVFSTCNALPTVAEVDLDGGALMAVHDLGLEEYGHAFLHPREDGALWIHHSHTPPVLLLNPASGEVEALETGLSGAMMAAALPGDGLAVAGPRQEGDGLALQILDADGALVTEEVYGDGVMGLTVALDGTLAALMRDAPDVAPELVLLDPETLSPLDACPDDDPKAVSPGTAQLLARSDGTYVATREQSVHLLRCGGEPWLHAAVEGGHRDALEIDGQILVLSRRGDGDAAGLNWGAARWYGPDLTPAGAFATGKNSGYGQRDDDTGLLWLNSEGTTELWAMDPAAGSLTTRTRVGEHVESVRPDPGDAARAFFTGRLINTFGDVDVGSGEVRLVADEIVWPLAPVRRGDVVWLLAGMTSELVEIDAATLDVRASHDLGLPENTLLTFHGLAWHPERDTLWLAHGEKNTLLELDPDTAEVLASWELAGPDVEDWSRSGRVEVLPVGDRVLVFRSVDGWMTLVDPEQAEPVLSRQLDQEPMLEMRDLHRLDWAVQPRDDGPLFIAGHAVDLATLERLPDQDLDATYVIGDVGGGATLVWRRADDRLAILDGDGAELASRSLDVAWASAPDFVLLPGEPPTLWYTELASAEVRRITLGGLMHDAGL